MDINKQVSEASQTRPKIGRIMPVNMPSEPNGLYYESLLQDSTGADNQTQQFFDCNYWACDAVRD